MSVNADWTILLYMAADNDLISFAESDLNDMVEAQLPSGVNVIVERDRPGETTERFRVGNHAKELLAELPNIDTGAPANLTAFVDWALDTYPANQSALVMWGHGGGWEDVRLDSRAFTRKPRIGVPSPTERRAAAVASHADTNRTPDAGDAGLIATDHGTVAAGGRGYLTDQDFRTAIERTKRRRVDLLVCDACTMGMIEVAYEMRNTASVFVASEDDVPSEGLPYGPILEALSANPKIGPRTLATAIVDAYEKRYSATQSGTLAAIQLKLLEPLANDLDRVAHELEALLPGKGPAMLAARNDSRAFGKTEYVDIHDLLEQLGKVIDDPTLAAATAKVQASLGRACFRSAAFPADTRIGNARGLTIFFPPGPTFVSAYGSLQLAQRHRWGGFLRALFDNV